MFQLATVYLFKSLIYPYVKNNVIYVADSTYLHLKIIQS